MKRVQYNVCIARDYVDGAGNKRIHFWTVGKAYAFEKQDGGKGINVKLWAKGLMVDEFVLFEDKGAERVAQAIRDRPNQQEVDTPDDQDIPF